MERLIIVSIDRAVFLHTSASSSAPWVVVRVNEPSEHGVTQRNECEGTVSF